MTFSHVPALVLGTALSIRTLPATPAPVSPFATLDVVKLAAATPGVLPEQGLSCPQGPGLRFGAEKGCIAIERLKSGQLAGGDWALILPMQDPSGIVVAALVYVWAGGAPRYAGFIGAPGGLRASVKGGKIVETTVDGAKIRYTIVQGKLERL